MPSSSRAPLVVAAVVGVLALTGGGVLVARWLAGDATSAEDRPTADSAAAAPDSAARAPAAASLSAPLVEPPTSASPAAGGASAAPATSASAPSPATTGGVRRRAAPNNCDPPYTVDAKGHHHPKPGCY